MTDITIPPEARMAATAAYLESGGCIVTTIRAALNAWPGMGIEVARDESEAIFLPLPTESNNDKAKADNAWWDDPDTYGYS